jgi:hypothetical protein
MGLRALVFLLSLGTASATYAALIPEGLPSEHRVSHVAAQIARMARHAIPVPVIAMTRGVRADGCVVYVFRLDMKGVRGAPGNAKDVTLLIEADVPRWMLPGLVQKAAAGAKEIIDDLRARGPVPDAPVKPVMHERVLY